MKRERVGRTVRLKKRSERGRSGLDPVELAVLENAFHSIAVEMGAALRRTAFSPNIKERRDYSSAVFDGGGMVVAMGDDMPVHLGSMPMSVRAVLDAVTLEAGDVAILNDPYKGGTHLPDITMVAPVFAGGSGLGAGSGSDARSGSGRARKRQTVPGRPVFYVANRAHHADVGGMYPGSMGLCREIVQEGIRIPPLKLVRRGELNRDVLALVLNNVRTPVEREGDLTAQMGACRVGVERVGELVAKYGLARVERNAAEMLDHSERLMRALIRGLPAGVFEGEDFLDDDGLGAGLEADLEKRVKRRALEVGLKRGLRGRSERGLEGVSGKIRERAPGSPVRLRVAVRIDPARQRVTVDFAGTDGQVATSLNAVYAITWSAVFYVFRCLLPEDAVATAGLMRPVEVLAPQGSVVNAVPPAAVAGGNVETSQRIVDVLLRALAGALPERIPAASSGTMNNLTIGGMDTRMAGAARPFAYYETVAGGMGASAAGDGASGVHTHMTNSLNTPVEALEYAYPFRVRQYALRRGSGGAGKFRGGDGLVRELELLSDAQVTLLADRRKFAPYGLAGGEAGAKGRTTLVDLDGVERELPGKCNVEAPAGTRIRLETPGGGGC